VSVVVWGDSSFIAATLTDENGNFDLSFAFEKNKTYSLELSLTGYLPWKRSFIYPDTGFLKHLVLTGNNNMLEEVTLKARKPLITKQVDRYIVNVENSFLSQGISALEVLQKSPGVWVDNKGSIRLKGTQPVMVMINDVVQQMSGDELAEYLRSLKSEDISRIEVIQNPPSEFEAGSAGGIIHIILKKRKQNGWNGSFDAQYRHQGNQPYVSAGASINYGIKNIYLAGNYGFINDQRYIFEKAAIGSSSTSYSNQTDRNENIRRHQYRLGLIYDAGPTQSINIQTALSGTRFKHSFITIEKDSGDRFTGIARAFKARKFTLANATLNYLLKLDSLGSTLKLIADYTENEKSETNDFVEASNDPPAQAVSRNHVPIATSIYSIQTDYTKLFGAKTVLKTGFKYACIQRDNGIQTENYTNGTWIIASNTSRFIYNENLLMFYASYETRIKRKIIKLGLRAEGTGQKGNEMIINQKFSRHYFGLFPSIFIMQSINEQRGTGISFSYARKLTRPGLSDLNPARIEFNNYTALIGNPALSAQSINNLSVGYQFLKDHSAELYLSKTTNFIALSAYPGNSNFIDYRSENVGNTLEYGFSLSGNTPIVKPWTIHSNLALYHSSYIFNRRPYKQTSLYARLLHTIILERLFDIDAAATFRSPYIYTNLYTYGNFSFDIGFAKKILNNKGRVRLSLSDLFNSVSEKELTSEENTRIEFYRKRPTRTVTLAFAWNLSAGKKISTKKIDQSNAEEKSRLGN